MPHCEQNYNQMKAFFNLYRVVQTKNIVSTYVLPSILEYNTLFYITVHCTVCSTLCYNLNQYVTI